MSKKFFICLIIILFSTMSFAGLTQYDSEKREQVRYAIRRGILSPYDIPFETYVRLEMWEEIEFIFKANNKNMIKYEFPDSYYSRPYVVDGHIWVFENAAGSDKGIYMFDPDRLDCLKKLKNKEYSKYDSGIRKIFGNTIISGGSDEDVDAAVIWNTDTNNIRTVKLQDGHYVGSIEVDDDTIYVGSCGGVVNAWNYDDLEFLGLFSSSKEENINWNVFNEKECITRIKIFKDKLIGVGEKTVFVWDVENRNLLKTYTKAMSNSIVCFYGNHMIEYKNDRFAIRDLEDDEIIKKARAEKSIEDMIVTSEKILERHEGELLILALRHNKGLLLYDFGSLNLLKKINANGETLATYRNTIFATDDRNLYKYDIAHKNSEKYEMFLGKIRPNKVELDNHTYSQLVRRLRDYPDIIERTEISKSILESHRLSVRHSFKYGKIGERIVLDEDAPGKEGYKEDVYGYKVLYEVRNCSENYYFVTLASSWSGEYGRRLSHKNGAWEVEDTSKIGYTEESFFISSYDGRHKEHFEVGEREPVNLLIYPTRIEKVSQGYYKGFITALSDKNEDVSLIDKYLGDNLVRNWHDQLGEQKRRLVGDDKDTFNIFKIFQ